MVREQRKSITLTKREKISAANTDTDQKCTDKDSHDSHNNTDSVKVRVWKKVPKKHSGKKVHKPTCGHHFDG